ncbi:hypothetical protein EV715DRAFT_275123 [Schizophyllum commune]
MTPGQRNTGTVKGFQGGEARGLVSLNDFLFVSSTAAAPSIVVSMPESTPQVSVMHMHYRQRHQPQGLMFGASPNAGADHLFYHDRPAPVYHPDHLVPVYHPDHLVPVYNHDLEALIWIFVWVVCCRDGGLVDCRDGGAVDCYDGQWRPDPLVRGDSHEVLASVRECLESKESFLSPITRWNGCKPAAEWGTPIPPRDLLFAIPAQPSTIWTAASATWKISGPATTPADELDGRDWTGLPELTVTPSALALCMLSYATGRIGARDPALARPMSQSCVEDRLERESSSMKVSEGGSRKVYMKNDVRAAPKDDLRAARKDDALGKAFADDPGKALADHPGKALADHPGKAWNDYMEMISNTTPSMPFSTTPLMPFGTPPFMAVDMLEDGALKGKVERLYRHDLESLFYVLTWATYCYTDGRRCYEDGRRCCNDARRLDPLPEMLEKWALGGFSIRPRDSMTYEDPYPLQTCRNSKFVFIGGGYQWPRDILPTGEPEDIPWREPGYIAEGLRFFFMEDEAERRAVRSRPAWRAYRRAAIKALREGREPPPRPREADDPEKMWEGFCAAVREVIEDIISQLFHCAGMHEWHSLRDGCERASFAPTSDVHPRLRPIAIPSMDAPPGVMASAVLNDWDLASGASPLSASDASPLSTTNTRLPSHVAGLLPSPPSITFAAIDILHDAFTRVVGHLYRLRDLEHLYRHDLEAFVWVFIWVACCIEDGTSSRCVEDGTSPRYVEDARRLDPLPELLHNRQAEVVWDVTGNAAPPEEEDEPEKDWKEFSQVFRRAGQKNPALDYLVGLVVG